MHIPKYWSEFSLEFQNINHKTTKIKRYGWSDKNQDDATQHAMQRCEQAKKEILKGKKYVHRIEPKNRQYHTPIREQIITDYPEHHAFLTVNRYGASCLNIENIMILDIDHQNLEQNLLQENPLQDFIKNTRQISYMWAIILGFLVGFIVNYLKQPSFLWILATWIGVGIIISQLNRYFYRQSLSHHQHFIQTQISKQGGYIGILKSKITPIFDQYPQLLFHLYQTPQGFRLIALDQYYTIDHHITQYCFQQLPIDPLYQRLCQQQQGYRARVTAKPWRMYNHPITALPYHEFWKTDLDNLDKQQQREQWLKHYQHLAQNYSACRFIEPIGQGKANPQILKLISIHDHLCQAHQDLPLA